MKKIILFFILFITSCATKNLDYEKDKKVEKVLLNKVKNEKNSTILNATGLFYYEKADYLKAKNYFEESFSLENNLISILYLTKIEIMLGNLNEALLLAKKAESIFNNPLALNNLAFVYLSMEEFEKAENILLDIIKNNYFRETYINLISLYLSTGEIEKARYLYEKFSEDSLDFKNLKLAIYIKEKDYEKGKNIFDELALVKTNDYLTNFNIASYYLNSNSYKEAILYFNKALVFYPAMKDSCLGLAYSYLKLNEFKKAEEVVKKGIAIYPNQAKFYLVYSKILIAMKNNKEADKVYKKYLDIKDKGV